MEQNINELHFSVTNFESFYINYLTRQNMLLDAYSKKISKKAMDIIVFQDIDIFQNFSIKIIKKIYEKDSCIDYSQFIIVFKYAAAVTEEKAAEDLYTFLSLMTLTGGNISGAYDIKAINLGAPVKINIEQAGILPGNKQPDGAAKDKQKAAINNGAIEFGEILKLWFDNCRRRAFSCMSDAYMSALPNKAILRHNIADFVNITSVFNTIAYNKLSYLKNMDMYKNKFNEIINEISEPAHKQWLENYAEIKELRFDSKLNIVFDVVKDIIVFPDSADKSRFIHKIMNSRDYFSRLNFKTEAISETNIILVKQFLLIILRMLFLQNIKISDALIKKAVTSDKNCAEIISKTFELIKQKKY